MDDETDAVLRQVLPDDMLPRIVDELDGARAFNGPWFAIGVCVALVLRRFAQNEIERRAAQGRSKDVG